MKPTATSIMTGKEFYDWMIIEGIAGCYSMQLAIVVTNGINAGTLMQGHNCAKWQFRYKDDGFEVKGMLDLLGDKFVMYIESVEFMKGLYAEETSDSLLSKFPDLRMKEHQKN